MIQDIIPGIYHNEYKCIEPEEEDKILFVQGRNVLMKKEEDNISYPLYRETAGLSLEYIYLFSIQEGSVENRFFLGREKDGGEVLLEGYEYEQQNVFRVKQPKNLAFAGITACQLANWYDVTRYCSRCAQPLIHSKKERMMYCPKCGNMNYPKIAPAVIVAVIDGDRIMMTKYAGRDYKKYALIAGYTEIGETIEDTVRREVMEEVGLRVKNIRYYKSQPWSFTDTVLLGYFCELEGSDRIKMDEEELATAEWLKREEIPTEYDGISLTNEMIMKFKNYEI